MAQNDKLSATPRNNLPAQGTCYHCGEAIPKGSHLDARVAGKRRHFCSENCLSTAEWINKSGLGDFYQLRTGPSERSTTDKTDKADNWSSHSLLRHVVRDKGKGLKEVNLLIDGMHCAGCAWLIERALLKLGGVPDIQINPVTHRACLTYDDNRTSLPDILKTLSQAGYQPRPLESAALDNSRLEESRDLLKRILVAGFGMMQVMMFAFVLYMRNFNPLPPGTDQLFRWLGFLVATPVVFYSALPFFRGAMHALKLKVLNMDVPIAIAIAAIYGTSVYQAIMFQGDVYFESVSMLVFFLLCGRYVEMRARHHSVDNADALIRLTPTFAERRKADGTLETVAVVELQSGDQVQVPEGAHLPADGELLSTRTLLDESLLSGEVSARQRLAGDDVIAGSLVLEGPIDVKLTRVGADTFLSTLSDLSTRAQTQRPKLTRQSEKATARFVFRVLLLTAATLIGWLWYDPSQALEATIAVLVVACPCALGLAAPAAITRALGVLAKHNILVVQPDALDTITRIDHAIFDKTGTLTEPALKTDNTDPQILQWAASLARESQHPLSRALVAANTAPLLAVEAVKSFPGMGLEGKVAGHSLRLGQASFVLDADSAPSHADASLVVGENGRLLARFELDESIRPDAQRTLQQLQAEDVQCGVLSGDSDTRVANVAQQLHLSDAKGRQRPADKLEQLKALRNEGSCLLAVGDGSNDAPVLAGADVSVALTSGAELAQANADVLLCAGNLSGLIRVRQIARETHKILRQNEHWAITYNTLAMPLAAFGFIPPWLAAICMSISSLTVVLNAQRIGRKAEPVATPSCCEATSS